MNSSSMNMNHANHANHSYLISEHLQDAENRNIFMPNELFHDLQLDIKKSPHIAFAYCYLYYTSYLYRYCQYAIDPKTKISQANIKQYLGYSATNKTMDYLTKKDGLLDQLNYTKTTTNYPVMYKFDDLDSIYFETIQDIKSTTRFVVNDRNFKIKLPVRCFHRTQESIDSSILDGTYYDISNTHKIPYSTFHAFMSDPKLQSTGFYLYAYLTYRCDQFPLGYQASVFSLKDNTKMSIDSLTTYLKAMEGKFIHIQHMPYNPKFTKDEREANIYRILG